MAEIVNVLPSQDQSLVIEIAILKRDIKNMVEDIQELKRANNDLLAFMYKIQGGKAWMLSMFAAAAALGAIFSSVAGYIFQGKP